MSKERVLFKKIDAVFQQEEEEFRVVIMWDLCNALLIGVISEVTFN